MANRKFSSLPPVLGGTKGIINKTTGITDLGCDDEI